MQSSSNRPLTDGGFTKFILSLICCGSILLAILSWWDSGFDDSIVHNIITHPLNESEIYHWRDMIEYENETDPEPFCDIPIDYYDKEIDRTKYYNSHKFTVDEIEELKKLRLKDVPMCQPPNGNLTSFNKYKELLSNLPPNLVPFTNKCVIKPIKRTQREMGGFIAPNPILIRNNIRNSNNGTTHHPPLLGFIHVFKAGGTSVRDTMRRLTQGLSRLTWHEFAKQFRAYLTDLFVFSFVRNPVDRLLSGHFELRRRNYTILARSEQTGIHSVKWLLKSMKNRLDCALSKDKKDIVDIGVEQIYYNIHILPQMLFLTNYSNPWGFLPINYIGWTTDIFNSTFEILYELYMKDNPAPNLKTWTKKDAYNTWTSIYVQGRDRHALDYLNSTNLMIHPDAKLDPMDLLEFQVESSDLTDDDIRNICEIYWMDYMCIPFEIPPQCNLTAMFIKHYGDNIVYKDCWDFTEEQYDPKFVDDMLHGRISDKPNEFSFGDQFAQKLKARQRFKKMWAAARAKQAKFPSN